MALGIYSSAATSSKLSFGGTFTNPLSLSFDGRLGGIRKTKLYVRNDSALYRYENIQVTPVDDSDEPIINDTDNGFVWKLCAGDIMPTEQEWANIAAANTISLDNIGAEGSPDTSTYLPFWLYIQIPAGVDIQILDHVKLRLTATEVLI